MPLSVKQCQVALPALFLDALWRGLLRVSVQSCVQEKAQENDIFPVAGSSWSAFKDIKTLLRKTGKQQVSEVMTSNPICVPPDMCMDEAARLLLLKKIHRLPVTNEDGRLVGVLSRGNVVKAVLQAHAQAKQEAGRAEKAAD